jgi:signal transduction histidine kinase
MKLQKIIVSILIILILCVPNALAGTCTRDDVKKAVDYAVKLLETKGKAAFPELQKFKFCGEEGYVWVGDLDGIFILHPKNNLVGQNQMGLQDPKGKYLVAEMIVKLKKTGEGWVAYWWPNPATNKLEPKCSYVKMANATIDGKRVYVGAGVYGISEAECK